MFLSLPVFASIVETLHFLNWCPNFDDLRQSEAPYKDFFFRIGWLNNDYCLSRKYFGFNVANIASKFKNLVLILHAGKMYCAKTSSFRFSRRSKWKTVHAFAFLLIHARAIGRSENPGGGTVLWMGFYADIFWESRCSSEIKVWGH